MYLKPIIQKLTDDIEVIRGAREIDNDKDMLSFLLRSFEIENIERVFTQHYGVEYKRLTIDEVETSLIDKFNLEGMKDKSVIPYHFDTGNNMWHFAISDLIDRKTRRTIIRTCNENGQDATFTFSFKHEIESLYKKTSESTERSKRSSSTPKRAVDTSVVKRSESSEDFSAEVWVENVINKGIELEASDVHIERLEEAMQLRYRVDGLMTKKETYYLNESEVSNIYVRLKIISNMDIVERRKPQDGRINDYVYGDEVYDLRVSSISTIFGEKFVLRIFNKSDDIASFSELGFSERDENRVLKMMSNKSGVVYLAGATGSGKTTTLYTMINEMDKESLNIYTIEDPVEKTFDNINQIEIDEGAGVTYASTLRALLRQDPDVIVVGEVRDPETAELSIRASLTGHLVLTTIHANSAIDSLGRLSDMGLESYLVGASSIGFLSQRLVRKLCPHCKRKVEDLKEYELNAIREVDADFDYEASKSAGNYIYEADGCDMCIDGRRGRVALVESVLVNDEMRSIMSKGFDTTEITKLVNDNEANKTIKEDGFSKLIYGIIEVNEFMSQS